MNPIASLIIPTHNRSASLKQMLQTLQLQSYPLTNFEIIVVADGCNDDTIEMVHNYKSELNLAVCELPGLGAASARNQGASMASGSYLIFVDDDMELSKDFIKEHISSHTNESIVAIGYSPFKLEPKASIQRMTLREWWEEKFQKMRKKDHRFKYNDLTSGNFSISSDLFKKVNGFNTSLLCREDYELGFRLIKAGAQFRFVYAAKAFHHDEITTLRRSLQRKKSEGMADIQIGKVHPDFVNKEAIYYLSQRSFSKSILIKAVQYFPRLCDRFANSGATLMDYFEKFNLQTHWLKMNYRLHQYWYLRGLVQGAGSTKQLRQFIKNEQPVLSEDQKLNIDLHQGLKKAEEQINELRPLVLDVSYGTKHIGTIHHEAGAEPIKGYHLRKILKENFLEELAVVLFPATLFKKNNEPK